MLFLFCRGWIGWTIRLLYYICARGNNGTDNFYTASMVIDGANHNLLVNNAASGNAVYDIEVMGETCLFGFLTHTSFKQHGCD